MLVNEAVAGTIVVGGFSLDEIPAGSDGSLVALTFDVVSCECSSLALANLVDDVAGWSTGDGLLQVDRGLPPASGQATLAQAVSVMPYFSEIFMRAAKVLILACMAPERPSSSPTTRRSCRLCRARFLARPKSCCDLLTMG